MGSIWKLARGPICSNVQQSARRANPEQSRTDLRSCPVLLRSCGKEFCRSLGILARMALLRAGGFPCISSPARIRSLWPRKMWRTPRLSQNQQKALIWRTRCCNMDLEDVKVPNKPWRSHQVCDFLSSFLGTVPIVLMSIYDFAHVSLSFVLSLSLARCLSHCLHITSEPVS